MKQFIGIIISDKMDKSAVVVVESSWRHPLYKKTVKRTKKYLVHNSVSAKEGDMVQIAESSPMSKRKRFTITKIL